MSTNPVRVGVLALHESKESKAILNAVEALGHEPEWLREENTVVHFTDHSVGFEPDVDVIVNRMLLSNTDQPAEELGIAHALANLRPMLNIPAATACAAHKIATAAALADTGIPVPDALFALSGDQLNRFRDAFGPEAVYKTAIGTHGGGAWKVGQGEILTGKVGKRRAFLQALVTQSKTAPTDLRVYIVDGQVVGAMYRHAAEGDWRTNVARGGHVEDATDSLSETVESMAIKATNVVGLDYAGVDIIWDDDGWYVLEVNPTAGFRGLYAATDRSPAPYIAQLAIERGGGQVDADRIRELAATLDDSRPTCTPLPEPVSFEEPVVIGFTERIVVSGTTGTQTVIGKADSGAARTSIDLHLAADIGAGPIHTVSRVRSGSTRVSKSRPVVDLVLGIGGTQHTVEANIEDRDHMDYPLLLGRDILRHYRLDVSRRIESSDEPTPEE